MQSQASTTCRLVLSGPCTSSAAWAAPIVPLLGIIGIEAEIA